MFTCCCLSAGLGLPGCAQLAEAYLNIVHPITICHLRIDHNPIKSEGCRALCKGLLGKECLLTLSLSYCGIESDGVNPLAAVLENPKCKIQRLTLDGNPIGGVGFQIVANALAVNDSVVALSMQNTGISLAESKEAIVYTVSEHPKLEMVCCFGSGQQFV